MRNQSAAGSFIPPGERRAVPRSGTETYCAQTRPKSVGRGLQRWRESGTISASVPVSRRDYRGLVMAQRLCRRRRQAPGLQLQPRRTFQRTAITRSHHRVAGTIGDLCESEPRAFSSERTASLSIHFSLLLAGGPSDSFPGIRGFGRRSFSMIWATYSVLTWTGRRAKNTSISERRLWVCFLAIGGPTSPFDIRATGLRGTA